MVSRWRSSTAVFAFARLVSSGVARSPQFSQSYNCMTRFAMIGVQINGQGLKSGRISPTFCGVRRKIYCCQISSHPTVNETTSFVHLVLLDLLFFSHLFQACLFAVISHILLVFVVCCPLSYICIISRSFDQTRCDRLLV